MLKPDSTWGPATILMMIIAVVVLVIGGIVVIKGNMTFDNFLDDVIKFAAAVGLLGVGRGLLKIGTK